MHEEESSRQAEDGFPKRDDIFHFGPANAPITATVTRVSRIHMWADTICVAPNGKTWTKRQRLPLPKTFRPAAS